MATVDGNVNAYGGGGVLQVNGQYLRAQGPGRPGDDLEENQALGQGQGQAISGFGSSPDDGAQGDGERERSKQASNNNEGATAQRDLFRSYHGAATSEDEDFR